MKDKIKTLEGNDTWSLVALPSGIRALGIQWVYRTKLLSNG